MSSLFSDSARTAGDAAGATPLTTGAATIVILLAVALLIQREIVRPLLSPGQETRVRDLAFLKVPLLFMVLVVLASRIEEILH